MSTESKRFLEIIAAELKLAPGQVAATAKLLAEGATVPFIARYRKEATGTMDEVAVAAVRDRMQQLVDLEKRREAIVSSLKERNLLTPDLAKSIAGASTMTKLEDLFAPFRPKRRTRDTIAIERGLEPLADYIFAHQAQTSVPLAAEAEKYVRADPDKDKAVPTAADALAGARDILAERFADNPEARSRVRSLIQREGTVTSRVLTGKDAEPEAARFKDYFDWSEPLAHIPSHRLLAIRRGEKEGFLMMRITAPEDTALAAVRGLFLQGNNECTQQVAEAATDSYKRLLLPSLETEARMESKRKADVEAVRVFASNLRELLLSSPMGQKRTLAVDPGFRTGCKLAVLDEQGKLQYDDVIHLVGSASAQAEAKSKTLKIIAHFKLEAVAIGNGTASRETESFFRSIGLPPTVAIVVVNESGASIYSASEVAREEFPDKDLTVRGAVSIGRRLMDPLAELVKIDPKSIGVGQYQHDVDQKLLKDSLDDTVISCVNQVGVELNTASLQLLSYVSGLNPAIAGQVIQHRNTHGPFRSRKELLKVPRLGEKTFEQAAGFLRIRNGEHPLDASAVHPEAYAVVERMASDLGCTVADLLGKSELRARIRPEKYVTDTIGLPTLRDIVAELNRPGRDPRARFEPFTFAPGVEKPSDLEPGMKLPGIVTNVTAFGAFVDVGVHQDGLVHVSQLADQFVKDPADVVRVGQKVMATVVEVDLPRNRIALSLRSHVDLAPRGASKRSAPGPRPKGQERPKMQNTPAPGSDWFTQALGKNNRT